MGYVPKLKAEKKKGPIFIGPFLYLAERTGLEPATPGVTGRYSNQLNYRSSYCNLSFIPCSKDGGC